MARKRKWIHFTVAAVLLVGLAHGRAGIAQERRDFRDRVEPVDSQQRVMRLREECLSLRQKIDAGEGELGELRRRMAARLTVLYKFRALGYASILLPGKDIPGLMSDVTVKARIGQAERGLSYRWVEATLRQRHLRGLLTQRQEELGAAEREPERLAEGRETGRHAHRDPARSSTDTTSLQQPKAGLFKRIPYRKPIFTESAEQFHAFRGMLLPPTVGEMVPTYGSKDEKRSETFLHGDGITFIAPKGQPVEAVFDGVVVFSDWLREYGNVMIIDHGDHYHSLIAHAERLMKGVGDSVKAREVVATVGSTGSSSVTQLYFEIRHHGKPVNPMEWLASGK